MVKEKEAFLANVAKVIDAIFVIISYVFSYFFSVYIREIYDLGEMAYAIAPNLNGLLFFAQNNLVLIISSVPTWLLFICWRVIFKKRRNLL